MVAIEGELRPKILAKGVVCAVAGEAVRDVYFPLGGVIARAWSAADGTRFTTSLVGWESALGITGALGPRRALGAGVVRLPGPFVVMPAGRLRELVERHPPLRDIVIRAMETGWAEAEQMTYCHANHHAARRLCRLLLQCADRTDAREILLTQDDLAEMIGVRRTTATLFARHLRERGIIRYSRGRIVIADRPALEACSCECYELSRPATLEERVGFQD